MKTKSVRLLLAANASLLLLGCSPKPAVSSPSPPAPAPASSPNTSQPATGNIIEGAFGKKFGDVFDPASAIGKEALEDGTPMYQFTADKPLGSMDKYYVLITPTTHKIYSIWASGEVSDEQAGNDQEVIMQLIEKKYGPPAKDQIKSSDQDIRYYTQGTRMIVVEIHRYTQPVIEVRYEDTSLRDTADAENKEIAKQKADKVDNSGL